MRGRRLLLLVAVVCISVGISGCKFILRVSAPVQPQGGSGSSTSAVVTPDGRFVLFTSSVPDFAPLKFTFQPDAIVRDRSTGSTILASRTAAGGLGDAGSSGVAITPNGRFVVFNSDATNMAGSAIGGVFLRDLTGGTTERVSLGAAGSQVTGQAFGRAISDDGRYVVFSAASNILPGGVGASDVYIRDRTAGTTSRLSVSSAGVVANGSSGEASISADGRFVVFSSDASNLVAGDTNNENDAFVRDRATNTTTRVSLQNTGGQAASFSNQASVSNDGRYVAFSSADNALVSGDTVGFDVFVRDRTAGTTTRVSVTNTGAQANAPTFGVASISTNGRYIGFASGATNLVTNDVNGVDDVFVRDRVANTTTRVSIGSSGAGNLDSNGGSVSPDGRFVAFDSLGNNLASNDTNNQADTFLRDQQAATTDRVSVTSDSNGTTTFPMDISSSGRYVAFTSLSSNLGPVDTNGVTDVYLRDVEANTITRMSVSTGGVEAFSASRDAAISANGRYVAFTSSANNLVSGDTNNQDDVFLRDRQTNTTTRVSFNVFVAGSQGNGPSFLPDVNDAGDVVFVSAATNFGEGTTTNNVTQVYMKRNGLGGLFFVSHNPSTGQFGNANSTAPRIAGASLAVPNVVWGSDATNLQPPGAPADNNSAPDVYARVALNAPFMVSQASSTTVGNNTSAEPAISDDGRYVAFSSFASNLVAGDTNAAFDIFRRQIDPTIGGFSRVSVATAGTQSNNHSSKPTVSADGRWVGYTSTATNLVTSDTNGASDIFTRDVITNVTTRVSTTQGGDQLPFNSLDAALSGSGRYMAFRTGSAAVPNDLNNRSDVYLIHAVEPAVTSISASTRARGTTGNHTITGAHFLPDATVLFAGGPSVTVNSVTYVSPTQLTVSLTVPAGSATGPLTLAVVNPGLSTDKGSAEFCSCFSVT